MNRHTPPRVARRLVSAVVGRSFSGRGIVDDLDEEFAERAAADPGAARQWYRREAAGFLWRARTLRPVGDSLMTRLALDVRHAARSLWKQPRFTLLASLTLALGVGAVTVIFSLVNGVLFTPLPYDNADRLVNVWSHSTKLSFDQFPSSPDLYVLFEKEASLFDAMAISQGSRANLTGSGAPDVVDGVEATSTYFDTLGIRFARGRAYTAAEDRPGGPKVVVITDRMWRAHFGADPNIVGRQIQLNGESTEIVGVTARAIDEAGSPDYFLPARVDRANPVLGNFGWTAIARLKPRVDVKSAEKRLTAAAIQYGVRTSNPGYRAFLQDGAFDVQIHDMKADLVGDLERPLWILLGTVGLLLAIACANVANLFLVRSEGRQLEIALRTALGGIRSTLVRGLLAEAVVLSLVGSAIGVVVAAVSLPGLLRLAPPEIPRLNLVVIDWRVMLFAAGVAVASALVFGLVPALRYTRPASMAALRQGGRGGTGGPARRRARSALVVLQTAIAVVLLVGSGLLARSFAKLAATNPGFDSRDVMTFQVALPEGAYPDRARRVQFAQSLSTGLAALSGAQAAGAATGLPMTQSTSGTAHEIEGHPVEPGALPPILYYVSVAGDFFTTLHIPVVRGRAYTSADYAPDARAVVVNEALAAKYWPGEDPIGKRIRRYSTEEPRSSDWYNVVGVVGSALDDGLRRPAREVIYYAGSSPNNPDGPTTFAFVVRGAGITARADDLRRAVWSVDGSLPIAAMQPMSSIVSATMVEFNFTMLTLGIASALALVLGSIGLYGVLSYAVTLQTREIGVKLALGATPGVVMRAIVTNGVALAAIGTAIGLAGAWGLTRYMADLLFETAPLDPATFAAMAVAMLVVACLASYVPARRAARVSPLESMKAG